MTDVDSTVDSSTPPRESWFEIVAFHAVLSGLCPLVPVPFVDALLLNRVKKRLVREMALEVDRSLTEPQVAVLSGAAQLGPGRGCVAGCLVAGAKLTASLILRLFKKVVFFLTFKEAVDEASKAFYEGVLLHRALTTHVHRLPESGVDDDRQQGARLLRKALVLAMKDIETRPIDRVVRQVFLEGKRSLAEGARLLGLGKSDPDAPLPVAEEQRVLAGLTKRLRDALWHEQATIALLHDRMDQHCKSEQDAHP